jgi:hypothetical protein
MLKKESDKLKSFRKHQAKLQASLLEVATAKAALDKVRYSVIPQSNIWLYSIITITVCGILALIII